jgi:hypothetical protein
VTVRPGGVFLDAASAVGIAQLGLAASYPNEIPHPPCQGIGLAAFRDGLHGVVPLSAVAPAEEELVAFAHAIAPLIERGIREAFAAWASSI